MYGALHKYALGQQFLQSMLDLFVTTEDQLSKEQNKVSTRMLMKCMERLVREAAQTVQAWGGIKSRHVTIITKAS